MLEAYETSNSKVIRPQVSKGKGSSTCSPHMRARCKGSEEAVLSGLQISDEGAPRLFFSHRFSCHLYKVSPTARTEFLPHPSHHWFNCKECFIRSTREFNKLSSASEPEEMVLCQSLLKGTI